MGGNDRAAVLSSYFEELSTLNINFGPAFSENLHCCPLFALCFLENVISIGNCVFFYFIFLPSDSYFIKRECA